MVGPLHALNPARDSVGHRHQRVPHVLGGKDLRHAAANGEDGGRVADEGVRIAQEAGLRADPVTVEAAGPVWKTILDIADHRNAAMIVMGSRGLTGVRSMLLGSVSSAVVNHADRPTLVIRPGAQHQASRLSGSLITDSSGA